MLASGHAEAILRASGHAWRLPIAVQGESGIERVYFAVVGRGFRQTDLEKLAGFMTRTAHPQRHVHRSRALLRLVNDSIRQRREFRLAEVEQLLFGNKVLDG